MKNKRLRVFDFYPGTSKRFSTWSLVFGRFFGGLYETGFSQHYVQRYCATSTRKSAQRVIYILTVTRVFIELSLYSIGLVIFAYYATQNCDPLKGDITSGNQLLPYFLTDVLNHPGFPGLFISVIAAASLSTASSVLNSVCALTWKDCLSGLVHAAESMKVKINRALTVMYGLIGLGATFLVGHAKAHILWISIIFSSSTAGPLLGVYMLGLLSKRSNFKGVFTGCIVSAIIHIWMGFGSIFYATKGGQLPTSSNSCSELQNKSLSNITSITEMWNFTMLVNNGTSFAQEEEAKNIYLVVIHSISPLWYPLTGSLLCIIIGYTVSCMTVTPEQPTDDLVFSIKDFMKALVPKYFRKNQVGNDSQYEVHQALQENG